MKKLFLLAIAVAMVATTGFAQEPQDSLNDTAVNQTAPPSPVADDEVEPRIEGFVDGVQMMPANAQSMIGQPVMGQPMIGQPMMAPMNSQPCSGCATPAYGMSYYPGQMNQGMISYGGSSCGSSCCGTSGCCGCSPVACGGVNFSPVSYAPVNYAPMNYSPVISACATGSPCNSCGTCNNCSTYNNGCGNTYANSYATSNDGNMMTQVVYQQPIPQSRPIANTYAPVVTSSPIVNAVPYSPASTATIINPSPTTSYNPSPYGNSVIANPAPSSPCCGGSSTFNPSAIQSSAVMSSLQSTIGAQYPVYSSPTIGQSYYNAGFNGYDSGRRIRIFRRR